MVICLIVGLLCQTWGKYGKTRNPKHACFGTVPEVKTNGVSWWFGVFSQCAGLVHPQILSFHQLKPPKHWYMMGKNVG